jgi:DNA-binding NarL/FixJ family response regulator
VSLERSNLLRTLKSPDPTASEVFIANECEQRLTAGQSNQQKQIIALKRLGHTKTDIAAQLGLQVRTVRRILRRLLSREDS